jgi:GNAT superfamily N-acetyltransferase
MKEVFEIRDCDNKEIAKSLIREYSTIKGAEQCFVSLDKELADLDTYYHGGAFLIGYENNTPIATIAIRKMDEITCELKRLYVKTDYRGKGYARLLVNAIMDKARKLGFQEVRLTTKPTVMPIAYGYYKRIGFEELGNEEGTVSMRFHLSHHYYE